MHHHVLTCVGYQTQRRSKSPAKEVAIHHSKIFAMDASISKYEQLLMPLAKECYSEESNDKYMFFDDNSLKNHVSTYTRNTLSRNYYDVDLPVVNNFVGAGKYQLRFDADKVATTCVSP